MVEAPHSHTDEGGKTVEGHQPNLDQGAVVKKVSRYQVPFVLVHRSYQHLLPNMLAGPPDC